MTIRLLTSIRLDGVSVPSNTVVTLNFDEEAALVQRDAARWEYKSPNADENWPPNIKSNVGAWARRIVDIGSTLTGRGTLLCDWSQSGVGSGGGAVSAADFAPDPQLRGACVTIPNGGAIYTANSNTANVSTANLRCVGFWAKAAPRADGQPYVCGWLRLAQDAATSKWMFSTITIRCDGRWRFHVVHRAQFAVNAGFVIGSGVDGLINQVRVQERTDASNTGRRVMSAGESVEFGPVYVNPVARPKALIRFDDGLRDLVRRRIALAADFVGASGVTVPAGVAHSALSLCEMFGLRANAYVLTRDIGLPTFARADELRRLQDEGWVVGFQSHANTVDNVNRGLRLLGPAGWNVRPIGAVSSVDAVANTITVNSNHDIISLSGQAGEQGYPITFIGSDLPAPLNTSDVYWLRAVSATVFSVHATESDAVGNLNAIDLTSTGTAANFGYRYAGSANDASKIREDFDRGQGVMQTLGLNGWMHYAPNQGAWDTDIEAVVLDLARLGRLQSCWAIQGATGVTAPTFVPRVGDGVLSAGIGFPTNLNLACTLGSAITIPTAVQTDGAASAADVRAVVDDAVSRGAVCGNYHHAFTQANMVVFLSYLDQVRLRQMQGLIDVPTIDELSADLFSSSPLF